MARPEIRITLPCRATEMSAVGGGPNMAAELDVIVQVTNVEETGSVEVKWLQPEVNTPLPAILSDPDGPHARWGGCLHEHLVWKWYRAKVANPNFVLDVRRLGEPSPRLTPNGKGHR